MEHEIDRVDAGGLRVWEKVDERLLEVPGVAVPPLGVRVAPVHPRQVRQEAVAVEPENLVQVEEVQPPPPIINTENGNGDNL